MKFGISDIVTAFSEQTIGTKVTCEKDKFLEVVAWALEKHDRSTDSAEGQHFVQLPASAAEMVSCGTGRMTYDPDAYIVRLYRDEPSLFLRREYAAVCTGVAAIVYTREAYKADPQVTEERFKLACPTEDETHVLIAVLGFSDSPKPPVSSKRFVRNIAGGNNAFDFDARLNNHMNEWKKEGDPNYFGDSKKGFEEQVKFLKSELAHIRLSAKEIAAYERIWHTVAD